MTSELITVEYKGPAVRQVGSDPWYEVRAWWRMEGDRSIGNVKRAAGDELKRHVKADHVEFVSMDMDTHGHPSMNAMLTFRVFTAEQFTARAELRARVYAECNGCREAAPGYLVRMTASSMEHALCFGCWHPIKATCKVLHWIKANGRIQI